MKFAPKTRKFAKKLKKFVQKIFFLKNRCINIARGVKITPKTAKEWWICFDKTAKSNISKYYFKK